jgi:hypothetical protein
MTPLTALLVLAAAAGKHTQETTGLDVPLLIISIVGVFLVLAGIFLALARTGRARPLGRGRARARHDHPSSPRA